MKVVVSQAAEADLETIADWIAQDNPRRALSFVIELRDACMSLGHTPRAFPLEPRHEAHGIRRRVHGNYLIFYRIDPDQVTIIHILHGARDFEPLLFPEG
jgi:plasmid stabilization system protein ParE